MSEGVTFNAFWCFSMAGAEPRAAGMLDQVPSPTKGPPSFTNLGVREVPLRGRCWCSPLQFRRAERVLLRNAVYRVVIWFASVTNKFSGCNPRLAITEMFKLQRVVLFHSGYNSDKGCFWAARWWLIIPTLLSHLGQAAAVPGRVSAASSPALQEFPVRSRDTSLLSSYTKAKTTIIEIIDQMQAGQRKRVRMQPHRTPFLLIKCTC